MNKFLFFLLCIVHSVLFVACHSNAPTSEKRINDDSVLNEMIDADIAFSEMCSQKKMKTAFIEYIDDEGVLLRPNLLPVKGAGAMDFLSMVDDTSYTLHWVPEGAQIGSGSDLGYTYGVFTLEAVDTIFKGTYVNIWKKHIDGKWKFVLNSTNQGIGP